MKVEDGEATISFIVYDQPWLSTNLIFCKAVTEWKGFSQVIIHSQYIHTK